MNYKIPKKIELLGETYQIKQQAQQEFSCSYCGDSICGRLDWERKTIYLDVNSSVEPIDILLHELGHYFGDYYSIGDGEIFAEAFARFVKRVMEQLEDKNE